MNNRILISVLLIISTLLIISCANPKIPRTIYWSGFHIMRTGDDTSSQPTLYLGYYIEISDTGQTRLMTRKLFMSPKEYYIISLPESDKKLILNLAANDSMYYKPKFDQNEIPAHTNDGFKNNLRFKSDSINKSITLMMIPESNNLQKNIVRIMNNIWEHPSIKSKTIIDLKDYEKNLEKEVLKIIPFPPWKVQKIKFVPQTNK